MGNFGYWIEKLHVHYYNKTGLNLYPGTLNVELDEDYHLPAGSMRLEKEEYGGRVSVSIQSCEVYGRKAFILRTDLNASGKGDHPLNLIEIATDFGLRDTYGLKDNDVIEITVPEDDA